MQRVGLLLPLLLLCTRHLQLSLNLPPLPLPKPGLQARKYAFKCHRKSEGGKDSVYPVNAIAFNRRFGTFATGGRPAWAAGLCAGWRGSGCPDRCPDRCAGRRCRNLGNSSV